MRTRMLACGLAAALIPSGAATAAPQMLGLVVTDRPVPVTCEGTICSAELTAFCLEEARKPPLAGRRYRAVDPKRVTLLVTGADGLKRSLPATGLARFVATRRGIAAVRIEFDRARLEALGKVRIAVRVAPGTSLFPVPKAGDRSVHSAREIARVAGPMRVIGSRIVDRSGPRIGAARLINRAINRLPKRGRAAARQRAAAWRQAGASASGYRQANAIYRTCARWSSSRHTPFSLRSCLEEEHKLLMSRLTQRYWDASRPGF